MTTQSVVLRVTHLVWVTVAAAGLLTGCGSGSSGNPDSAGGVSSEAASQFEAESLDRVASVSRMVVLVEVASPVRNLPVADLAPLDDGGKPIRPVTDYETASVRVVSVLAQQAGAEVFGIAAGSVVDVGVSTALRTPRPDNAVVTPYYRKYVLPGSTLPDAGGQVVLFLSTPADATSDLDIHGALRPTEGSPDPLDPSSTPRITGVNGPIKGQLAPPGWLAAAAATLGSGISALPAPPA